MNRLSLWVLFGLALFAVSFNDVISAEVVPTESECRPYIEKAIHELQTGEKDDEESGEATASTEAPPDDDDTNSTEDENKTLETIEITDAESTEEPEDEAKSTEGEEKDDDSSESPDTDGDGIPDHLDEDDDGDGIPDHLDEDDDGDGIPDKEDEDHEENEIKDTDGDGIPDHLDDDDDNDGIPDELDDDDDGDGIPDSQDEDHPDHPSKVDTDGDGIPDYLDDDDDNDGIPDELDDDDDGDGIPDSEDEDHPDHPTKKDTDGDGIPDYLDDDDDNDGIPDELDTDDDGDGIPDSEDEDHPDHVSKRDTDGDGIPDHLDEDDDNDGIPDHADEDHPEHPTNKDTDGDGIPDHLDEDDDGDGIPDHIDEDDDGDGVPDHLDDDHAENKESVEEEEIEKESVEEQGEEKKDDDEEEDDEKASEEAEVKSRGKRSVEEDEDDDAKASTEGDDDDDDEDAKASTEGDDDDDKTDDQAVEEEDDGKESEEDAKADDAKSDEDKKESQEAEEDDEEAKADDDDGDDDDDEDDDDTTPEDELLWEGEIPENLRDRKHISELLHLDEQYEAREKASDRVAEIILRDIKKIYEASIKPLETLYKYRDLSNRHFGDPEIFSKPLVVFMGPWSGGKSSTINYLTGNEYTDNSLRTGAEPSPAYFNILMWGNKSEVLDGTQLSADYTFSGLQKFGQGLEDRLRGLKLPSKLLEKINIVEIPGILEVRKQVQRLFPFNDACQWFIDRADMIVLMYDPAKLDAGPETEAILDQLKGREYQTRIILNKADTVHPEELLRVQSALIWNISPLMSSAQPPVMYTTSLWSHPYESGAPVRLLQAQERAFLRDLRTAVDKRIENRIASARRFAVRVRNHAKMVDCYLNTYYNHKTLFGNKKRISDDIIDSPQNYHIYEGLSTLTNISRYDLPDPEVYRDFFRLNPLYEFKKLSETCTYFRGCPITKLDTAIAYDLPELVNKYKKMAESAVADVDKQFEAHASEKENEKGRS